jgi:hypothetical protein
MPESENQNIGELANEQLGCLTNLEELLDDLKRDQHIPEWRLREAVENLEQAQGNSNEILRRFEETVGPISTGYD